MNTAYCLSRNLPSGHDVVVVDNFDERLDLGALGDTLLSHGLGDFERVLFDTGEDGVSVRAFLSAFIELLHDDGFLASILARQNNDDLSGCGAEWCGVVWSDEVW